MIVQLIDPVFQVLNAVDLQKHFDELDNVELIVAYNHPELMIRVLHVDVHYGFECLVQWLEER